MIPGNVGLPAVGVAAVAGSVGTAAAGAAAFAVAEKVNRRSTEPQFTRTRAELKRKDE